MPVEINIPKFSQEFQDFFNNVDKTPLLNSVGNAIFKGIQTQFETEGSYFLGQKWSALAPFTVRERQELGYTPISILYRTGLLRGSIGFDLVGDEIVFKVGADYGYDLQYGTPIMPARPFMPVNDNLLPADLKQEIIDLASDFFELSLK